MFQAAGVSLEHVIIEEKSNSWAQSYTETITAWTGRRVWHRGGL